MGIIDTTEVRRRLHARRFELLSRYREELERADAASATHEPDPLDQAEDEWSARVLASMSEVDARELDQVVAAIARLDAGVYGRCIDCDEPIAPSRLSTRPEAARCIDCAELAEGRSPRAIANG